LQLRTVMQRLAEAENKTNNSDEHYKLQLKTKNDELQGKQREVTKMDEEVRKIREERKNDLNTFFVNLSQIEDAITAMKCLRS
jgi:negative regulator of sigma E activity